MKRDCKIADLSLDEAQILLQIIQNTQICFSETELRETVIKPLVKITEFGVWSSTLIFFDDEKHYIDSIHISNMPEDWVEEYISKNYFRIDPVVNTSLARSNEIHRWEDIYSTISNNEQKNFIKLSGDFFEYRGLSVCYKNPDKREMLIFILTNGCDTMDPKNKLILELIAPHIGNAMGNIQRTMNKNILSQTQINILELIEDGKTATQIATSLGLTKPTISYHIRKIKEKIDANNIPSAIAQAQSLRILEIH